jgi:hypothetical protein
MPKYLFAAETNGCVLEDGSEAVADETNNAPIKPHNNHLQPTQSPPFPQVFLSAQTQNPSAAFAQSLCWGC